MKRLNYAIVFVSDMKRSVAFYRDVLGLPLKFESPHWSEFSNEGSAIALHLADSINPEGASEGGNPAGTCQLGFHLVPPALSAVEGSEAGGGENLDEAHRRLQAQGVRCVMPPRTEEFGIRQAVYADPDGLQFTLAESVKK
ncbi:VOC family protein [Acidobacteriia bacterium AH_259_A11_L15]|nr:VOC family protein [Acidobacteriia bacterium AH_259_A11_L15]